MPSGPDAIAKTLEHENQVRASRNNVPKLIMTKGDIAIIRPLASGQSGDTQFEMRQVHGKVKSYDWLPCPTSGDNALGECECDDIEDGYEKVWRCGVWVWVYGIFKTELPTSRRTGKAFDWPETQLSRPILELMYGRARANSDKQKGRRYFNLVNGPAMWFRGKDFNDAFVTDFYYGIAQRSKNGMLHRHDTLLMAVPGTGMGPDWGYEVIDAEQNPISKGWPEANHGLRTPEVAAEQRKYYEALPPAADYFMNAVKWPLFKEDEQAEAVPVSQRAAPASATGTAPSTRRQRAAALDAEPAGPSIEEQGESEAEAASEFDAEASTAAAEGGYVHPAQLAQAAGAVGDADDGEEDEPEREPAMAAAAPKPPTPQPPTGGGSGRLREFME